MSHVFNIPEDLVPLLNKLNYGSTIEGMKSTTFLLLAFSEKDSTHKKLEMRKSLFLFCIQVA